MSAHDEDKSFQGDEARTLGVVLGEYIVYYKVFSPSSYYELFYSFVLQLSDLLRRLSLDVLTELLGGDAALPIDVYLIKNLSEILYCAYLRHDLQLIADTLEVLHTHHLGYLQSDFVQVLVHSLPLSQAGLLDILTYRLRTTGYAHTTASLNMRI